MSQTHSTQLQIGKYCCGGNDFIIQDCRETSIPDNAETLAKRMCNRREGIGSDGLIFLLNDPSHPFRMKLFNADGSPAEVSYNGSRCVGKYALDNNIATVPFTFGSDAGKIDIDLDGNKISLKIPSPVDTRLGFDLDLDGERLSLNFIRSGVPWVVFYADDLTSERIEKIASSLKIHPDFPEGTNVVVGQKRVDDSIEARFFERGVNDETPSSGSGCVSVALISSLVHDLESPVIVRTEGGDFGIHFERTGQEFANVVTAGEVACAFRGNIVLPC